MSMKVWLVIWLVGSWAVFYPLLRAACFIKGEEWGSEPYHIVGYYRLNWVDVVVVLGGYLAWQLFWIFVAAGWVS